ncbi:unnamed protein product, partial [Mesorhabditis spiculigera]
MDSSVVEKQPQGPEYELPPWHRMFEREYLLPIVFYFAIWRCGAYYAQRNCWNGYEVSAFTRYRLRNLTVCLFHAAFTAISTLVFMAVYPDVMFHDTIHWWSDRCAHIFLASLAYFLHDQYDMVLNEWTPRMVELFLHHTLTIFVYCVQLSTKKFQPYAFWAIMMEVNSVFLHVRAVMMMSGWKNIYPKTFQTIRALNLLTFLVFRFGVQSWQIWWIMENRFNMHYFYFCVGYYGGIVFLCINTILFARILYSDGYLCKRKSLNKSNTDMAIQQLNEPLLSSWPPDSPEKQRNGRRSSRKSTSKSD